MAYYELEQPNDLVYVIKIDDKYWYSEIEEGIGTVSDREDLAIRYLSLEEAKTRAQEAADDWDCHAEVELWRFSPLAQLEALERRGLDSSI